MLLDQNFSAAKPGILVGFILSSSQFVLFSFVSHDQIVNKTGL